MRRKGEKRMERRNGTMREERGRKEKRGRKKGRRR